MALTCLVSPEGIHIDRLEGYVAGSIVVLDLSLLFLRQLKTGDREIAEEQRVVLGCKRRGDDSVTTEIQDSLWLDADTWLTIVVELYTSASDRDRVDALHIRRTTLTSPEDPIHIDKVSLLIQTCDLNIEGAIDDVLA